MKVPKIKPDGIYKATVCQRCGEVFFAEFIFDDFEKLPEGWTRHDETGYICPQCEKEYENLIANFMSR